MKTRGSYHFEIRDDGHLADNTQNLEAMRKLFRDGEIVEGRWGDGDEGDFDHGSWHMVCHLMGGSAICRSKAGLAWLTIGYDPGQKLYFASASVLKDGSVLTRKLQDARSDLGEQVDVLALVEGSSLGHISARGVEDDDKIFNKWQRQAFDQPATSSEQGGTVWEHWCTTRDLRPTSAIGNSVLAAYLSLVSVLGGRYVTAVARGRRSYDHPVQLRALVKAGFVSLEDALWDTTPVAISPDTEALLYEARPAEALRAAALLVPAGAPLRYHMFRRGISQWSETSAVREDMKSLLQTGAK